MVAMFFTWNATKNSQLSRENNVKETSKSKKLQSSTERLMRSDMTSPGRSLRLCPTVCIFSSKERFK